MCFAEIRAGHLVKCSIVFIITICLLLSSGLFLSGCSAASVPLTVQSFLLDTVVSVTFYREKDRAAVNDALALCQELELIFSRTDSRSELYHLNESDQAQVSDALLTVLQRSLDCCEYSGGRFDITMGGVSELYDFAGTDPQIPAPEAIASALTHVGYHNIRIDGNCVRIEDPETVVDLGAAAKGYIADEMKALLLSRGVEHAIISLGGNILTLGTKPDGEHYQIGIRDPEKESELLSAVAEVSDLSVVTSGIYERFFVKDGVTYHHILDSVTGLPVQNGLRSVTIVGPCSMDCDLLSTACFTMGTEDALALIEKLDGYEALFIREDKTLFSSSGFPFAEG